MADARPFRGFRFDLGRAGVLSELIAPPYDVIDDALRAELLAKSEFNAVRVELPAEDGEVDRYTAAARELNGWISTDHLRQDTARAFYVLEQEFVVDGVTHIRRGFLARVRVEPLGTGNVYAHEQTMPGPKADRLKLYQATGFNISPVFGLYPDPENEVADKLTRAVASAPPLVAVDHLGVINRLWLVIDQSITSAVMGLMGPRPVYIADGHHRYETALRYLEEVAPADADHAANFCLMHLVGMADPGLIIQPTHRVVSGLSPMQASEIAAKLAPTFEIVEEFADASACWEHLQLAESQELLGFVGFDGRAVVVELADNDTRTNAAPDRSPEWRSLAVSLLHTVALPMLAQEAEFTVRYHHEISPVIADLKASRGQLAALVPAATMAHVEVIAGGRETMPPKSTYFYPKVPTGLVFNSLKRD